MIRRILALLAAVFVLGAAAPTAAAHPVPDVTRKDCSIEVTVHYDGRPVSGGTLTATRVGEIGETDGNFFFRRIGDGVPLENVQSASAAKELEAFVKACPYPLETQTVSLRDGRGIFRNLPTGLYLITQKTPAPGYSPMGAFLVSVPYLEDGSYRYHVTAAAKPELEREPKPTTPPPAKPSGKLPQTGQQNWPIPVLAAAGLALFTLGWRLQRKKENPT